MTARPNYTVWCDIDDCPAWDGSSHTAAESRKECRRRGWSRVRDSKGGMNDLCPKHTYEWKHAMRKLRDAQKALATAKMDSP